MDRNLDHGLKDSDRMLVAIIDRENDSWVRQQNEINLLRTN